ncbi:MAG: ABC transporter ATP-binding protein [Rhodospirillales bacterium]|nr:ABC transporter ATP-binding protein [Rhodospirillales bacterium]
MTKSQFIWHYFLLNKYSYLFAVVCIFIVNWLQVEIPRYIQQAIDLLNVTSDAGDDLLTGNVQAVIILSLAMIMVRILSRIYALNPGRITEMALKNDLFHRLNRLPQTFHNQFPSGKLISIINNDLNGIRVFYSLGFLHVFNILFAFSLTPLWMWQISPKLTLYSVIPIIIGFIFFRMGFRQLRQLQAERLIRLQNLSEQLMNYLSGIDLIKNQQMGPWAAQKIEDVNQQLFKCTMQITRIQTFVMPIIDYANHLMKVLILGLGGYYVLQSALTIGEITAFLSYSVLLAVPLMSLGRILTVYQMGMVSIDSIQTVLNSSISAPDLIMLGAPEKRKLENNTLKVVNLCYRYPTGNANENRSFSPERAPEPENKWVLKNISFTIEPGKKLGILGSIGAGKSTLVNCLNHHLDVAPGQIFWGDRDITGLSRQDLRSFVRTITQNAYLFSTTIEKNVRFGSARSPVIPSPEQVKQVLEISQLSEDIRAFHNHEQTIVGEKGIMLSGGQKQRLSIARALLTPGDLIIMDNVLSAVDYETERNILKAVFRHINEKSLLVVSHRISALETMDEILVMDEGRIIARGTHAQLLATSGYYRETWELQQHNAPAPPAESATGEVIA